MRETVYLLLGSNLGDRVFYLEQAVSRLGLLDGVSLSRLSAIYESDAVDMSEEAPAFLNQVIEIDCELTPEELLSRLESIEQELGRTDKALYKSRTLDIDILLFGSQIIRSERLTVPHARLTERPFALVPLLELDSALVHPATGEKFVSFLSESARNSVVWYKDYVARAV